MYGKNNALILKMATMTEDEFRNGPNKPCADNPCVPNIFALMETTRLRDQFAMFALSGMLTTCAECPSWLEPELFGNQAYAYADAMMAARTKKQG